MINTIKHLRIKHLRVEHCSLQSGFTLIELLVGMVIGLLATLVVMQTFSVFEGNKRSTTGIADAQTNGSLALYLIQRELQSAGYGLPLVSGTMPATVASSSPNTFIIDDYSTMTTAQINTAIAAKQAAYNAKITADSTTVANGVNFNALNCGSTAALSAINLDIDGDTTTANATSIEKDIISPIIINDNTNNGTNNDIIDVHYGTTTSGGLSADIVAVAGGGILGISNTLGCRNGDVALTTRDGSPICTASLVTSSNTALDAVGTTNTITLSSNSGVLVNDKLSCLGKLMQTRIDVSANQLQKNGTPIIGDIVSLQAQYGVAATANSEIVSTWVDGTGATWAPANITVANRNRIKAVRIAVVARNNLLEKDVVTQLCTGTAAGPANLCVFGGDLNLATALGANWVNYRYRAYEVVVPIRNMLAAGPQL